DAYPDWTIAAHVIAIIPTADRSKATVKVRIAIEQKDPRILPDMGVRVSFLEQAAERSAGAPAPAAPKGVLVPAAAIVEREGKSVIFIVDGSHARARAVTPGQSYGDLRLVEGIAAGTQLLRSPPQPLNDGAGIVITKQ
ncbi:MAG TPA: hypothetical protein VII41_10170, partial [Steroidobacteraceae bacterium]